MLWSWPTRQRSRDRNARLPCRDWSAVAVAVAIADGGDEQEDAAEDGEVETRDGTGGGVMSRAGGRPPLLLLCLVAWASGAKAQDCIAMGGTSST